MILRDWGSKLPNVTDVWSNNDEFDSIFGIELLGVFLFILKGFVHSFDI